MRGILPLLLLFLLLFCLALPAQAAAQPERRVALIIGNGAYPTAPLKNPVNDATDMDAALKRLGFETMLLKNASMQQMETAVREFGLKLRSGGLGLFYYAGHGVQVGGENFLVPVNAAIQSEGDVKYGCLNAGLVLAKMEDARNGVNVVILDACRNNPFRQFFRDSAAGLARMDAPTGSLIAYATAPGTVAADGAGRNGLYTQHLLKNIVTPGLSVTDMFMNVREAVVRDSARKQVPWENTSLIGRFSFAGGTQTASLGPSSSPVYTPAPLPKISAPPKPGSGSLDLSDIDADAAARAKAEAEQARLDAAARTQWATRLKAMQSDYAKVQTVEKSGQYTPEHKAKAWEKLLAAYSDKNPYTDQDQTLRAKAQAQQVHWEAQAASLAAAQAKKQQMMAMAKVPSQPSQAPPPPAEPKAGDTWTDPTTGMEFVWVPGGSFEMGCGSWTSDCGSDEKPVHSVRLSGFWLGKYEVTNAEYRKHKPAHHSGIIRKGGLFGINAVSHSFNADSQPVVRVTKADAKAFADWLSKKGNGRFRLPTEAEWEYAARSAGKPEMYAGGNNDVDQIAWYAGNSEDCTHPVGSKLPNGLSIYDMSGNVWEIVEDVYDKTAYTNHRPENPVNVVGGENWLARGGGWYNSINGIRTTDRCEIPYAFQDNAGIGFRLVRGN